MKLLVHFFVRKFFCSRSSRVTSLFFHVQALFAALSENYPPIWRRKALDKQAVAWRLVSARVWEVWAEGTSDPDQPQNARFFSASPGAEFYLAQ